MVNKESLLVLAYSSNPDYTILVKLKDLEKEVSRMHCVHPEALKIDIEKQMWSYHKWKNIPFGSSREYTMINNEKKWGIIGVYDQTDFEQVQKLVFDSHDALRQRNSPIRN